MIVDKALILRALKTYMNFRTDSDFAKFLEIAPNVLSNWYKRNTFDEHIIVNKFPEISKSWILSGEGEMLKTGPQKAGSQQSSEMVAMPREVLDLLLSQQRTMEMQQKTVEAQQRITESQQGNFAKLTEAITELAKKGGNVEKPFRAASVVVEDE